MAQKKHIPVHHFNEAGTSSVNVEWIAPAESHVTNGVHRHDFYEMFFFKKGSGDHMVDLDQHPISAPCMHLVSPGMVHRLSRSADTEGAVVMFSTNADLGLMNKTKHALFAPDHPISAVISADQLSDLYQLISTLQNELEQGNTLIASNYLGILIKKCASFIAASESPATEDSSSTVTRFKALLEANFIKWHAVSDYADELNLSAGHLSDLLKKSTGQSCGQAITARRILEAKRLLLHADLSIKEIAYALEIDDPAYFTRMFKKATSQAPGHFRATIREKYK